MGPVADSGSSPSLPLTLDTSNNGPNGTPTRGVNVVGNVNGDGSASQTTNNNASSNHNKYSSHEAGSPTDQSSLTVLQPSGTGGYSSMLPSFSHYATGKFFIFFGFKLFILFSSLVDSYTIYFWGAQFFLLILILSQLKSCTSIYIWVIEVLLVYILGFPSKSLVGIILMTTTTTATNLYLSFNHNFLLYFLMQLMYKSRNVSTVNINSKLSFALFLGGGTVVPGTDYAYSPAYTQYGSAYGSYGYSAAAGGLLSK